MNENKEFKLEALVEPLCLWYERKNAVCRGGMMLAVGDYAPADKNRSGKSIL